METTYPLGNNVIIEVIREHEAVSRTDATETLKSGILRAFHVEPYHLTASATIQFDQAYIATKQEELKSNIGKTVRWEEYAEGGQTFTDGDKTYASLPWWRLITITETTND